MRDPFTPIMGDGRGTGPLSDDELASAREAEPYPDAHLYGPNRVKVAKLIERPKRLTERDAEELENCRDAVRDPGQNVAWNAAQKQAGAPAGLPPWTPLTQASRVPCKPRVRPGCSSSTPPSPWWRGPHRPGALRRARRRGAEGHR
jgi:hypothetical protein